MHEELNLVKEFHTKFQVPVLDKPTLIPKDRSSNRYKLMYDEVGEYANGVEGKDLENITKELADILYAVYGTILEHGLQEKMQEVFKEVHKSNMSKDYHQYKMVKGESYKKADISDILS